MNSINWKTVNHFEDITYKKCNGVARIAFNRPDVRNAFRPKTTSELLQAFHDAQEDTSIGVVLLGSSTSSYHPVHDGLLLPWLVWQLVDLVLSF
jgi:naphthoate synthase